MKIQNIDKATAVMLGEELFQAAQLIAQKYGVAVTRGSGKYSDLEYKVNSVTFSVTDENSDSNDSFSVAQIQKMKDDFTFKKSLVALDGIEVGDIYYDSKQDSDMKVLGWDRKKRKYPILVECVNTKTIYKMTPESLKIKFL